MVDLSLLRAVLDLYWFPKLDIYVFGNTVTATGDDLFVFSAELDKKYSFPFACTTVDELSAFLCGKMAMTYSDGAGRAHSEPHDWLSSNGFDVCRRDVGDIFGRVPAAVFSHPRARRGVGVLIEEDGQRLAVLMSESVLAVAQAAR